MTTDARARRDMPSRKNRRFTGADQVNDAFMVPLDQVYWHGHRILPEFSTPLPAAAILMRKQTLETG
jgi:hypothetical protein